MLIPKVIHQTFHSRSNMPDFLSENINRLQSMNPGWQYRLYDDGDCERFIRENYGDHVLGLFQSIHPSYGAARADLFRYLLIYRVGGVYLDIKSGCRVPLDSFLQEKDEFLLSYWRDPKDGDHSECGIFSEFQQWHIMARPQHPFLGAVLAHVSEKLRNYDPLRDGVGKRAVLQVTGPIAYTRAILPLLHSQPHRFFEAEEAGVIYSTIPVRHDKIFRTHYSKVKRPLVRFAFVKKEYFSPRILPLLLIYLNGRFYRFLTKAIKARRV
jgi:hypothetical protein